VGGFVDEYDVWVLRGLGWIDGVGRVRIKEVSTKVTGE